MSDTDPAPHVVDHRTCTGELVDHGALVLAWAPVGTAPVVWRAPGAPVRRGTPPHAGVPVCWPWFGPGRYPGMSPSHGMVRTVDWELVGRTEDDGGVALHHRVTSDLATSPHFPYPYVLDLRTRFGSVLELELTTTNTGAEPFELEEALHAYLRVGDVRRVHLEGLDGAGYHDKTTGRDERQAGDLTISGETDSVYRADAPVTVVDPVLGRRLRVTTIGAADRVVWNPWDELGRSLDDVGPAWDTFVCVEGGNVLADAVTVEPGASRSMTYRLEVLPDVG
jgi:glucose-6-phosphate 1-epimerase